MPTSAGRLAQLNRPPDRRCTKQRTKRRKMRRSRCTRRVVRRRRRSRPRVKKPQFCLALLTRELAKLGHGPDKWAMRDSNPPLFPQKINMSAIKAAQNPAHESHEPESQILTWLPSSLPGPPCPRQSKPASSRWSGRPDKSTSFANSILLPVLRATISLRSGVR